MEVQRKTQTLIAVWLEPEITAYLQRVGHYQRVDERWYTFGGAPVCPTLSDRLEANYARVLRSRLYSDHVRVFNNRTGRAHTSLDPVCTY